MGEFSITHLLLVAAIFLLFFGPSRLPQLGQSLGKAIRSFKQGLSEIEIDAKDVPKDSAKPGAQPTSDQLAHENQQAAEKAAQAEKKDFTPKS